MSAGLALVALVLGAGLGLLGALVVLRRPRAAEGAGREELSSAVTTSVAAAVAAVQEQAVAERDGAVQAALQQAAVLQRQQLEQVTAHHRELMDQAGLRLVQARPDDVAAVIEQSVRDAGGPVISAVGRSGP